MVHGICVLLITCCICSRSHSCTQATGYPVVSPNPSNQDCLSSTAASVTATPSLHHWTLFFFGPKDSIVPAHQYKVCTWVKGKFVKCNWRNQYSKIFLYNSKFKKILKHFYCLKLNVHFILLLVLEPCLSEGISSFSWLHTSLSEIRYGVTINCPHLFDFLTTCSYLNLAS